MHLFAGGAFVGMLVLGFRWAFQPLKDYAAIAQARVDGAVPGVPLR